MPAMYESAQVGKRQEILPKIYNVEAQATPFLSDLRIGEKPKQMALSWLAEVYPDVASTGIMDGAPVTGSESVGRETIEGCCHHFRRTWGVSTLANLTDMVGVGRNEAGRQMLIAMLLHKKMMSNQLLSNTECAVQAGPSQPWTTRGAYKWLQNAAQAVKPVPASLRPAAACMFNGALTGFTEQAMRTLLEACFDARKSELELDGYVGTELKAIIDDWTNVHPVSASTSQPRVAYQVRDNDTYLNMVDTVRFSVGTVRLKLEPGLLRNTATGAATTNSKKSGLFLDMNMWEIAYLFSPANTNLPPDGSGVRGFIDAVAGMRCLNPLGQGAVIGS